MADEKDNLEAPELFGGQKGGRGSGLVIKGQHGFQSPFPAEMKKRAKALYKHHESIRQVLIELAREFPDSRVPSPNTLNRWLDPKGNGSANSAFPRRIKREACVLYAEMGSIHRAATKLIQRMRDRGEPRIPHENSVKKWLDSDWARKFVVKLIKAAEDEAELQIRLAVRENTVTGLQMSRLSQAALSKKLQAMIDDGKEDPDPDTITALTKSFANIWDRVMPQPVKDMVVKHTGSVDLLGMLGHVVQADAPSPAKVIDVEIAEPKALPAPKPTINIDHAVESGDGLLGDPYGIDPS